MSFKDEIKDELERVSDLAGLAEARQNAFNELVVEMLKIVRSLAERSRMDTAPLTEALKKIGRIGQAVDDHVDAYKSSYSNHRSSEDE